MAEKILPVASAHINTDAKQVETRVVTGDEAFNEALLKEPPTPWSRGQLMIYLFSLVAFFNSTVNGYDGSLINNLLQNPSFIAKYNGSNSGIWAGIVSSMYQIGNIVALPFLAPVCDHFGRRAGMASGSAIIIIGTIIQGTSDAAGQFMGGRFLLGFGASLVATGGPMYVVEVNHPAYRGVVGAMYNTLWFSGSILSSGAARGAANVGGDYSWRLITWLQILFPSLVLIFSFILPESPRWLYVHNRKEKAKAMLVKYHGNGNESSPWVSLQLREYEECLNMDGADKRWWDYRVLFRKGNFYRLCCNLIVSGFAQLAGNAVLSYFLGSVLDSAGYTSYLAQVNITLVNNCVQFLCAMCGALLVDRVGRRPLLLFAFTSCTVVWLGMTIATSQFAASYAGKDAGGAYVYTNGAASKAALAMIFLFGAAFSIGITPIQGLYVVEVLSFEMRAKGMAMSNLAVNLAGLLNQYAWSVSMKNIGWKTYIIFTVWDAISVIIIYFTLPETKGRTLEELDHIFAAENPVKASTSKKEILVSRDGDVVEIKEAST
ncbi:sugar transporter (hexose transporter) [Metarhizium acridum CQMa 102]|uniref:Sugar transporter (Hexose transporter) n=1 Tax=Metarhizium acridum (strain CQMa 102) TaxID=655827 RepID=E9E6L5_METAQ|nr:sugar transporter (hexose transporter) [Metarhizium acridum CQMa 102]EFY88461.1 sugar transporter (hexose transporter) [Metarhizium acridum CQMa 102]